MTTPASPASCDFVIIGAREDGQTAAYLARARESVVIVDGELFDGFCPYWVEGAPRCHLVDDSRGGSRGRPRDSRSPGTVRHERRLA